MGAAISTCRLPGPHTKVKFYEPAALPTSSQLPPLHPLLQSAAGGDPLPGAIVRPALLCQLLLLMWRLRGLEAGEFADTAR